MLDRIWKKWSGMVLSSADARLSALAREMDACRLLMRCCSHSKGRFAPILLKTSFRGDEPDFLEPLMRFMRSDARDHVASQKNDCGPSYRFYSRFWQRSCPKISICEIFGVLGFSTFSTVTARSRRSPFDYYGIRCWIQVETFLENSAF
jgi:hypothetical protein